MTENSNISAEWGGLQIFPPQYRTIGIASPASLPDEQELRAGIAMLESCGYRVILAEHALDPGEDPYVCGTSGTRTDDLNGLIRDPRVDLILCARGGYGVMHLLDQLDFDTLRARNLPVLGYSDISALHLAMLAKKSGIPVVSPMAAKLPSALAETETAESFRSFRDGRPTVWNLPAIVSPATILPASFTAPAICSNLTLLAALCGTGYLPDFTGSILVLEDVGEKIRVLDRYLTQLLLCGILRQARAIVFGHLTDCGEQPARLHLLRKFAALSGKPVFYGLPFGHEPPQMVFRNGSPVTLISTATE